MNSRGYTLLLVILGGILLARATGSRFQKHAGLKSWFDADADCRSRLGHLPLINTDSRMGELQRAGEMTPKVPVWTAAYRQHSPWIWVEGCFSNEFIKQRARHIGTNQGSECAMLCQDTTYAALQGRLCYCLDDIRRLQPLDSRVCDTPCPGSPNEMCGGVGAVSLYSMGGVNGYKEADVEVAALLEPTAHEASRADWKNCVYILKHNTAAWITSDCRKALPFLCKIYRKDGSITEYKSPEKKKGTWTEAQALCREEGGTLADLHANNQEAVSALPGHSEFWVGLYRNTSWAWHTADTDESPMWCTAVSSDSRGGLHFTTESCSLPHEYICEIGPDDGVQAAAAAQASSMTGFVVGGCVAWFLAVAAIIGVVYSVKKWKCRRGGSSDGTAAIRTSYFDLDEESVASRQHSYVNDRGPTCTAPSPPSSSSCDPSRDSSNAKPGTSQSPGDSKSYAVNGNEYACVTPSKGKASNDQEQYTTLGGACATTTSQDRTSISTEGDYDHVWDSLKLERKLQNFAANVPDSSENVYTEIGNAKLFQLAYRNEKSYTKSPAIEVGPNGKVPLGRMRSKSL